METFERSYAELYNTRHRIRSVECVRAQIVFAHLYS